MGVFRDWRMERRQNLAFGSYTGMKDDFMRPAYLRSKQAEYYKENMGDFSVCGMVSLGISVDYIYI